MSKMLRKFLSPKPRRRRPGTAKHPQPSGRVISRHEVRVPPTTGFTKVRGEMRFLHRIQKMRVTLMAVKASGNRGPAVFERTIIDWRSSIPVREARLYLEKAISKLAAEISGGKKPGMDMYLSTCNSRGAPPESFMENTCVRCACPYCEISDG